MNTDLYELIRQRVIDDHLSWKGAAPIIEGPTLEFDATTSGWLIVSATFRTAEAEHYAQCDYASSELFALLLNAQQSAFMLASLD